MRAIRNVLILSHASQQPPYNTMLRFHNWGKELVKRGYNVVIVAASTVHNTQIDVVDEIGCASSIVDGIRYEYIKAPKYSGNGFKRIKNMLAYCVGLKRYSSGNFMPDVIISTGCYKYPFVKKYFPNVPIIVDTVDLWPLSIIEYSGISKYNPLIQYLYYLEKKAYIEADALIFSMEGGEQYLRERSYQNKIDFSKVFHINMGIDIAQTDRNLQSVMMELPWDKKKKNIVYIGSIRKANNVKQICDAALAVKNSGIEGVEFQIYGNGDELDELISYSKTYNIDNIHFYGRIQKEMIPGILANATANILTYKQVGLMKYGGSQSKLFDYLASGKPIICNAKFGYNLIERYNCGVVTENQTAEAFAKAVISLCNLSNHALETMGINARKTAEMYDQPILVDCLEEVFVFIEERKKKL